MVQPANSDNSQHSDTALWWIKRDIRVADNSALHEAVTRHQNLVSLFVLEPDLLLAEDSSLMHLAAQLQALRELKRSLNQRGGELWIASGNIIDVLQQLKKSTGFSHLFSHQESGNNLSWHRDKEVTQWCLQHQVQWHEQHQNGVVRGSHQRADRPAILAQRLLSTDCLPAPAKINQCSAPLPSMVSTEIPEPLNLPVELNSINAHSELPLANLQNVTESAAHHDLQSFLQQRGLRYSGGISSPNTAFVHGSRLSVHLAWGTISLRTVFSHCNKKLSELAGARDSQSLQWTRSLRAFQSRLFWHDHFIQRLESATHMEYQAINPSYRQLEYPGDSTLLDAWCHGQTGLPLVDACMRCLRATGFLNFRMRAMLVSVGCYGLGLSWKDIQYPLARVFLDYEPGIHYSQVQMQAGVVGINTIRIYNPQKQLLEQDAQCQFVKQWIPELKNFSAEEIACYNTRTLGTYSTPVTDIEVNNRFMKEQIFNIRKSPEGIRTANEILLAHGSGKKSRHRKVASRAGKASKDDKQLTLDF